MPLLRAHFYATEAEPGGMQTIYFRTTVGSFRVPLPPPGFRLASPSTTSSPRLWCVTDPITTRRWGLPRFSAFGSPEPSPRSPPNESRKTKGFGPFRADDRTVLSWSLKRVPRPDLPVARPVLGAERTFQEERLALHALAGGLRLFASVLEPQRDDIGLHGLVPRRSLGRHARPCVFGRCRSFLSSFFSPSCPPFVLATSAYSRR